MQEVIGSLVIGCGLLVCMENCWLCEKERRSEEEKKETQIKPLVLPAVSPATAAMPLFSWDVCCAQIKRKNAGRSGREIIRGGQSVWLRSEQQLETFQLGKCAVRACARLRVCTRETEEILEREMKAIDAVAEMQVHICMHQTSVCINCRRQALWDD